MTRRPALSAIAPPSEEGRLDAPKTGPICLECGGPGSAFGDFCCAACRKSWNNRRMVRGAELYDLFMALRYERRTAYPMGLFGIISRAAAMFRREDLAERAGRKSWRAPSDILERRPYLRATILQQGRRV
jgi:hypothetical protein